MHAPNSYNNVEIRKRRQHPEWFAEEDAEYGNNPDVIVRRLEKKLDKLVDTIETLPDNDSQFTTEVKDIAERLKQLTVWLWVVSILFLILVLLKLAKAKAAVQIIL